MNYLNRYFKQQESAWKFRIFSVLYLVSLTVYWLSSQHLVIATGKIFHPIPTFEILGITELSQSAVSFLFYLAATLFLVGAVERTRRPILLSATFLYFLVYGQAMSYVRVPPNPYVWHSGNSGFFMLLLLAIAPHPQNGKLPRWCTDLVKLTIGLTYFGAFYSRMSTSGLSWIDGEVLRGFLFVKYHLYEKSEILWMASQPTTLLFSLALLSNLFEATCWLGLFLPQARWFYVSAGVFFHVFIWWFMKINFVTSFGLMYLIFLPDLFAKSKNATGSARLSEKS